MTKLGIDRVWRRGTARAWAGAVLLAGVMAGPAAAQNDGQVAARVGDTFGDWLFECTAIAEGQTACSLTQTIVVQETGRAIAKFSLSRGATEGTAFFLVMLPLGLDIPAGVRSTVDTNEPIPLLVETCVAAGCLATAQLDSARLQQMKAGMTLNLTFRVRGELQAVTLAGSLKGITAGMTAARIQ